MPGLALLRVVSNDELSQREEEERRALMERQNEPLLLGIQGFLRECWDAAVLAKKPIEQRMLKSLRQRNGQYDPDKLAQIRKHGGSEVFMNVTEVKCRAGESWLRDTLLDEGAPPWDIVPTPVPDLPEALHQEIREIFGDKVIGMIQATGQAPNKEQLAELRELVEQEYRFKILQTAQNKAGKMEMKIKDQFTQGGWNHAFNDFISDLVTFPAAIIKGPVIRRQRHLEWTVDEEGRTAAQASERLAPEFERVDPFNLYPEPGITRIEDGYLFHYHPLTRMEMADLIGVPGYDEEAIRELLRLGTRQSWVNETYRPQKEVEESKFNTHNRPTDIYDALEFWGKIPGSMLLEWGMDEADIPDPAREYDANVWLVGNFIIKATLNYDPLGEKPYAKTSFIKAPGAFWGKGIPEVIADIQSVANAAARSLVNNMGIASGPQVEVNVDRIPPNQDLTQMYPWMYWQTLNDPMGSSAPAVRFTQPESNADVLMAVYEKFSRLADDHSGIPAYIYGDMDVQGAGRTSSGLSMLMGAAGKGIRQVIAHIDADVIKPVVQRQFVYNMRYDEDESIKGDAEVVARGATNLAVKETVNVRRIEFLQATANPIDAEIVGKEGRAAILREVAKSLEMPAEEIVPSVEKMRFSDRVMAIQQQMMPQDVQALEADGSEQGGNAGNLVQPSI